MIIRHEGKEPKIDGTAYIAPNATICGDVSIGKGSRIMFGAQIIAESNPISIGENCIVLENAVIRAAGAGKLTIGNNCLIGPNAHLASCEIADEVFVATGASIFHGARVGSGAEIRINAIVHLKTHFPEGEVLPIGWIALGNPVRMFAPKDHKEIWEIQQSLNFPDLVYGLGERDDLRNTNKALCKTMSERLGTHRDDEIVEV